MFAPVTKKLLLLILLVSSFQLVFASANMPDSLNRWQQKPKASILDSLKEQLDAGINDSLKAPIYTRIAAEYLIYDTLSDKAQRRIYQNAAISNTLHAIHYYSKYNDSTGLRISFDALARIYHAQRKYTQAKWFIIQSNSIARIQNDNLNLIASLIELSSIKADIKDYTLAMRDLNEALQISAKNHYTQQQSEVQLHYALLYNAMKDYPKAAMALKRHNAIDDSIKHAGEVKLMAKQATKDSLVQAKKKLYTSISRKFYKGSSSKRTVTL
jgi:tetratricopeptide (TPR) repeat protein